jgi:hypothetical protein
MFNPLNAICDDTECDNNRNRLETLVCSSCGNCADSSLHSDCQTTHVLVAPVVSVCGNTECLNNTNTVKVVVCTVCGQCADCSLHRH